jgi:ATP-dependent Lhr-like helicase
MEERGQIRRGFFVSGVAATQFALPAALDMLRSLREAAEDPEVVRLAATDPANPFGALLPWPEPDTPIATSSRGPTRSVGAAVVMVDGRLASYVGRQARQVLSYLPPDEPDRSRTGRAVATALADLALRHEGRDAGLLIGEINGVASATHPLAEFLTQAGFVPSAQGFVYPRRPLVGVPVLEPDGTKRPAARKTRTLVSSPWAALRRREGE